jgi:hypothetical protein
LFSLPPEAHLFAMRLISLLNLEFPLYIEQKGKHHGGYPETRLMALLVIACKLGADLENSPEWQEWAVPTEHELVKDRAVMNEDINEYRILDMSDKELDRYMDWIESTWIVRDDETFGTVGINFKRLISLGKQKFPESILAMFPLEKETENNVCSAPSPRDLSVSFPLPQLKAGEYNKDYMRYKASAKTSPVLTRMIQRGANTIGVSEYSLCSAIQWLEYKLDTWRVGQFNKDIEMVDAE